MTTIVLCGSTRFRDQFREANFELSRLGFTVLTLADPRTEGELDPVDKIMFDLVYFEKIRLADAVLLIDGVPTFEGESSRDPYVGFSAAREILWAKMQDRPVFSLLSASGWGNVAECLEHRWDETFQVGHTWVYDFARTVLQKTEGVNVVQEQVHQGQHDIMHAGLSILACNGSDATTAYATSVLEVAGLDPITDMPALMPMFQDPPAPTVAAAPTEPMQQIERRRLVGTVIMVYALAKMAGKNGSRRDVADKLAMTVDTLLDSFCVSMQEVLGMLSDPDDHERSRLDGKDMV